jgi:hypothetical protein
MPSSTPELNVPKVQSVTVGRSKLTFQLADGRSVSAPLDWYPRLKAGTLAERKHWELIGAGFGVHWPDLDEDISVEGLLLGKRSMESDRSFRAWLARRPKKKANRHAHTTGHA